MVRATRGNTWRVRGGSRIIFAFQSSLATAASVHWGKLKVSGSVFPFLTMPAGASRQPFRYNFAKDASSVQVQVFWRELAAEASRKNAGNAFLR
jgi:hypothetical protein